MNPYLRNTKYAKAQMVADGSSNVLQDFVSNLRNESGLSKERVRKISDLSETNMVLLEENLVKLDKTLSIYSVTGVLIGIAGTLVAGNAIKNFMANYDKF